MHNIIDFFGTDPNAVHNKHWNQFMTCSVTTDEVRVLWAMKRKSVINNKKLFYDFLW